MKSIENKQIELPNLEKLLAPIQGDQPCGRSLKRDAIFIQLKELRSKLVNLDEDEQGIWVKKNKDANNWSELIIQANDILINNSKDLNVVIILAEAQFKIEGFVGFAKVLSLFVRLLQLYWEDIHPAITAGSFELRITTFKALKNISALLVKSYSFANDQNDSENNITWSWYETQLNIGKSEGILAKNGLTSAIENKSNYEIAFLNHSLEKILALFNTIEDIYLPMLELNEDEFVSFEDLIAVVQEIFSLVNNVFVKRSLAKQGELEFNTVSEQEDHSKNKGSNANTMGTTMEVLNSNSVHSIQAAYDLIAKANEFLLQNDPHSPSPYLIRRALDWRKKSLYSVLMELFSSTSKPQEIFALLGLSHFDKNKK